MRVAITAMEPNLESPVDPRFGRSRYLIVMDTDTGSWEAEDNVRNLTATQGAGIQSAQKTADLGVQAVVTGNVGPKAHATLRAAGIAIYLCPQRSSVAQAFEALKHGELALAAGANVTSHW